VGFGVDRVAMRQQPDVAWSGIQDERLARDQFAAARPKAAVGSVT
jgi:hypothetical protein